MRRARSSWISGRAGAVLLVVALGCAPSGQTERSIEGRPDGERGEGWFETPWGPEHVEYVWRGGQRIYDGDLVLPPDAELPEEPTGRASEALLSRGGTRYVWEMGPTTGVVEVPYEITNTGGLGATQFDRTRGRIRQAMDHWETYVRNPDGSPLLRFVPGRADRWVQFQVKNNDGVCYVALRSSGKTRVDSDPGCRWQTYVHEIGHVLTFRHEQKRRDRPMHVSYYPGRTEEDSQFTAVGGSYRGTTYDTYSIMHYPSCMFASRRCNASTPGTWVLERQRGTPYISWWTDRGTAEVLSPDDVCGTKNMYGVPCGPGMPPLDAGTAAPDAGAGGPDAGAGATDAGARDAGVPPGGGTFPVSEAAAGWIQSHATGVARCATPSAGGTIDLAPCDEMHASQRWGLASTGAFRNEGTMRCAEPAGAAAGAVVEERECRAEGPQRWRLGDTEVVNGASGGCVTVPGGDYAAGRRLEQHPCDGSTRQRFAFLPGTHELKAQGWCLTAGDADGVDVTLQPCDGGPLQRWIESSGGFAAGGLCMRVQGGPRSAAGAPIEVTACNGTAGQMWGLRGPIAWVDDELCLSAAGSDAPLELAACAGGSTETVLTWWPRSRCTALDCTALGASCGSFDDGCGTALDCGECPMETDWDAGAGAFEECLPLTCEELGDACGAADDGCGGTVTCDPCDAIAGDGCGCRAAGTSGGDTAPLAGIAALLLVCTARRRRRRR